MINFKIIFSHLSRILIILSIVMCIPMLYAFITVSKGGAEFLAGALITFLIGMVVMHITRSRRETMTIKDMFLFTTLMWVTMVVFAAIPIYLIMKEDLKNTVYHINISNVTISICSYYK